MKNYVVKEGKTIVTWVSIDDKGKGVFNVRKFSDKVKAAEFIDTQLPQRNVAELQVKTICTLVLREAN